MDRAEKKSCPLCNLKAVFWNNAWETEWDRNESSVELVQGPWTILYACKDDKDRLALYASGDSYTDLYHPSFCPECGRKLKKEE